MKMKNFLNSSFVPASLGAFLLFALFNPMFKKYDYGGGWPLVMLFAVIVGVLSVVLYKEVRQRVHIEKGVLLVFLVFLVLSFLYSKAQNFGLSEVIAYISVIVMYLLLAYRKNPWMDKFLKVVAFSSVMAALLGFFLYFYRPEVRMMGPFFNLNYHSHNWPNAFALFLLLTWPILLLFGDRKSYIRMPIILGVVLCALLLTFSRGAYIAFLGQIVLLFLYYVRRINLRHVALFILTIMIISGIFYGANYLKDQKHDTINIEDRIQFEGSEKLTSQQERLDFWEGAYELALEQPLLGYGPFSFRQAYSPIQKTFLGASDHPHNLFLKIAAENGLVAFGSFVLFLFTVFASSWQGFFSLTREKRDTVFILTVSVLGAFAHNLIDYNLNFIANLMLLFIFLAFIRSLTARRIFRERTADMALVFGVLVAIVSIFEGLLLVSENVFPDREDMQYSLFPRDFHIANADEHIQNKEFEEAGKDLSLHIQINKIDAQAFYLKGVIENNTEDFAKALELNPMNEWIYYLSYLNALERKGDKIGAKILAEESADLLSEYTELASNNVHFTAYTSNVENAYEFIKDVSIYLPFKIRQEMLSKGERMWKDALELRNNKTF